MQTDIPTCVTLFSLLHYFHLTNFFWMFVEGKLEFYKRDMDIISTSYKMRDSVALNNYKERNIVAQVRHLRRSKMKFNNLKKYTHEPKNIISETCSKYIIACLSLFRVR